MRNRVKWLSGWVGLLLLGATITMCGGSADSYCDAVCECRGCSDREFDNCVYDYEDREDDADRRGCLDLWDDYASCVESGDGCGGRDADRYCDRERDSWRRCVD